MIKALHFLSKHIYKSNKCFIRGKALNLQNMNPNIKEMYLMDANDPVYQRYGQLKQCPETLPFDELLLANSGDMQSSGYRPLTFLRQMASASLYPALLEDEGFPDDVKCKVTEILRHLRSLGCYTASPGLKMIRNKISEYLCKRDNGLARDPNDLMLIGGTTEGIRNILKLLYAPLGDKRPAILVPTPSYPYGLIQELGFKLIPYELDEENGWAATTETMECAAANAKEKYGLRAMIVINPSNPTGTVLERKELEDIVKFACKEKLVLVVDESFHSNIYGDNEFHSMKKVMADMGKPYSEMEMVSLFGLSKDVIGETGIRGGLMEVQNFNEDVKCQLLKSISVNLCSSSVGQVMMYAYADHPIEGDPSYELWKEETESRLNSFKCKAKTLVDDLNEIAGFSCPPIEGGFFAYPKIYVPEKAIERGKKESYNPSTFYALQLLEEKGVLVTPGDVFGKEYNPHIRISILPSEKQLKKILNKINSFNQDFLHKYAD